MNIEEITQEGWQRTGQFGDCDIYKSGEERLLYNPKTDKVVLRGIYSCNIKTKENKE